VIYLDSCALVKYYLREDGSRAVQAKLQEESKHQSGIFMSVVGYAEMMAIFARRWREKLLQDKQREVLQDQFQDDWLFHIDHVELTVVVLGFIPDLVKRYPLKGSDAIHLASALWLRDAVRLGKRLEPARGSLTFATSDKQLARAAEYEQLEVFDPEDTP